MRGRLVSTPDGDAVASLGIPFARVDERYQPAVRPNEWAGVRDSGQGPIAWQDPGRAAGLSMSERDCLTANVWTPAAPSSSPRPVLVWVHGGAHLYGSNAHPLCDGARLAAAHGLIVVAISYRLGALGYLRLDHFFGADYGDAGNVALRDTLSGVEWVRDEIAAFGGDPSRITLMGQSAGGVAVATLLAESADSAPFQRVIVESATAERVHTLDEAAEVTNELLEELAGPHAAPELLLGSSAAELIAAQERVVDRWKATRRGPGIPFRPVLDHRFVHDIPLHAIAAGAGAHIDAIIGTNRNEASGYIDLLRTGESDAISALQSELVADGHTVTAAEYIEACARDDGVTATAVDALESYVADRLYRKPASRLLDARRNASGTTYGYLFAWQRPDTAGWARRAGHSLELPFVFRHLDDSDAAREELGEAPPMALSATMSASWAAFAATGRIQEVDDPEWPVYESQRATIVFDETTKIVHDPFAERRRLLEVARSTAGMI
ncbi:hypothetical protein AKG07_09975 [Microbacterium sp. CGR1]|nr:hypothetical protein AKG07_09975 [Microbacterium sp. CGR1]